MVLKNLVGKGSHGMYKPWNYDGRHRAECRILGRFPEVADSATHPLPWRLTREQVSIVDKRVRDMWWPHHTHRLCKRGASFFVKSNRCWKARDKMTIFMVLLPTVLRGFVPAVHQALLQLVFALRRLEGQVVSSDEAKRLRVVPGSCLVEKDVLPELHQELVRGLVLLEGSLPAHSLNPALHHLVHYASQTAKLGSLRYG